MTLLQRVATLEAELAYYKSELGLSLDISRVHAIKRELGLALQEAQILVMLYQVYPRTLSRFQIWDGLDHPHDGGEGYATNSVNVRISGIRRKAGRDLIDVVQRLGVQLTEVGRVRLGAILEPFNG